MLIAGQMKPGAERDGPWLPASGITVGRLAWPDFRRRCATRLAAHGVGGLRLPLAPGWLVLMADQPDAEALDPAYPYATARSFPAVGLGGDGDGEPLARSARQSIEGRRPPPAKPKPKPKRGKAKPRD